MPFCLPAVALTVAVLYYEWRDRYLPRLRRARAARDRILRERITFMLWTATQRIA
jgi:hypothetical protein